MKKENQTAYDDFHSFAEGINAYVNTLHFYPIEFYMLGIEWEEWTVSDMFIIYKLLKWSQSNNYGEEYIRSFLLKTMTKQ